MYINNRLCSYPSRVGYLGVVRVRNLPFAGPHTEVHVGFSFSGTICCFCCKLEEHMPVLPHFAFLSLHTLFLYKLPKYTLYAL